MTTKIRRFYCPKQSAGVELPFFAMAVPAGYPSPVDGETPTKLNLINFLIKHPDKTFFATVDGDSMEEAGIYSGDLLVVDRAIEAHSGSVIVAFIDGEFAVKRFSRRNGHLYLISENNKYPPRQIQDDGFEVWGVVSHVIHKV